LKGLALARYENKDLDQAAELFLRIMREYPEETLNEKTYAWAGEYFFEKENWAAAAETLEALLKAVPDHPNPERVQYRIAEAQEKAGNSEAALALYQQVADAAQGQTVAVEAKYRMARLYEAMEQPEKAVALYEEAAATNIGEASARACFRMAELLEEQGDCERAARNYMRVVILFLHEELSPKALWRAGQCYEKLESYDQAHSAYSELLNDYPEAPQAAEAEEALKRLEQG
jgi:TolA-binding protein